MEVPSNPLNEKPNEENQKVKEEKVLIEA